jgi:hypothetical protein
MKRADATNDAEEDHNKIKKFRYLNGSPLKFKSEQIQSFSNNKALNKIFVKRSSLKPEPKTQSTGEKVYKMLASRPKQISYSEGESKIKLSTEMRDEYFDSSDTNIDKEDERPKSGEKDLKLTKKFRRRNDFIRSILNCFT